MAGGATENSASLVVISRALNIVYSIVLGIKCKDISSSFKLYRADVLKSLELKCDHFDIVEEIFVPNIRPRSPIRASWRFRSSSRTPLRRNQAKSAAVRLFLPRHAGVALRHQGDDAAQDEVDRRRRRRGRVKKFFLSFTSATLRYNSRLAEQAR